MSTIDPAKSLEISLEAAAIVSEIREMVLRRMDAKGVDHYNEVHLSATIALESMRGVFVHQYDNRSKDIIFQAAEKLVKPPEGLERPKAKG
jgi:hypothetical protein